MMVRVAGLGRTGEAIARRPHEAGNEVIALDLDPVRREFVSSESKCVAIDARIVAASSKTVVSIAAHDEPARSGVSICE